MKYTKLLAKGQLEGSMYVLGAPKPGNDIGSVHIATLKLWNERIAHDFHNGIAQMVKTWVVRGVEKGYTSLQGICEGRAPVKAHTMCGIY